LLTAGLAILFLLGSDPVWVIAAANLCYLIGIALPSVAVWLLRKNAPEMDRPYRAPRGTITLGLLAAGAWGLSTVLGFEQFGLPTVLASMALAYSGSVLYALRRWGDRRHAGMPMLWRSLHLKLTGAMLLVLTLDGTGYLLAINSISVSRTALITCLQDIFVAVAVLTITVGLVLPGMIGHAAGEVAQAANRLAMGGLADLSRATQALGAGDLDAACTTVTISPVVVHSRDELGAMAASFNTMQGEIAQAAAALDVAREDVRRARDELRASNAELARWSTELEQHVQERTAALRHRSEQLEAILAVGQHVRVHQSAAEVLQRVAEAARAVAGAPVVSAYLPTSEDPAQLECVAVAPLEAAAAVPPQIAAPVAATCGWDPEGTDEVLLVPLTHEGANVAGLLRLVKVPAEFGQEGRDALTILTTTAAIALENIGLLAREHDARAAAEEAVRVRDDFLTAASHDLRTPLTTIQGHADLMQMRLGTGAAIDGSWLGARIGALQQATRRMVATVEEITDVAELQIGRRLDLKVQPVDVGEMVRAAVALVEGSAPRGAAPVVVAGSSPVVVEGDGMRLERVLQNVIGNAVKYSPGGTPVQVRVSRQEDWAVITVRDGGVGIPAAELPYIFSKYYRASTSIGIKGTGIGLAGAKAIVTQHGGHITLDSIVGQGTTVVISLPCCPHPWSDEESDEEEVQRLQQVGQPVTQRLEPGLRAVAGQ
jgi:signal transduction histidine kinase